MRWRDERAQIHEYECELKRSPRWRIERGRRLAGLLTASLPSGERHRAIRQSKGVEHERIVEERQSIVNALRCAARRVQEIRRDLGAMLLLGRGRGLLVDPLAV